MPHPTVPELHLGSVGAIRVIVPGRRRGSSQGGRMT